MNMKAFYKLVFEWYGLLKFGWPMRMTRWMLDNERNFKINYYNFPPIGTYIETLPFINSDGPMMDVGCGNGMFLKFLTQFSGRKLTPYGINVNKEAIKEAKEKILPEYVNNFKAVDAKEHDFNGAPFNIILTDPTYYLPSYDGIVDALIIRENCWWPDIRNLTDTFIRNLNKKGRLIYRTHQDSLDRCGLESLEEIPYLRGRMNVTRIYTLEFAVFDKT